MYAARRTANVFSTQRRTSTGEASAAIPQSNDGNFLNGQHIRQRPRTPSVNTHVGIQTLSPRRRAAAAVGMNEYNADTDVPADLRVRALYDYRADDPTSLSFHRGDVLTVITQLESGWWDGYLGNTRGWFPSNYCVPIDPKDPNNFDEQYDSETSSTDGEFEDGEEESDMDIQEEVSDDHTDGPQSHNESEAEAAFWIPQATPDGRMFYFNTRTGQSRMELPFDSPPIDGPDRPPDPAYINVPLQTKAPPEMMAGGSLNRALYDGDSSEAESESSTGRSRASLDKSTRRVRGSGINTRVLRPGSAQARSRALQAATTGTFDKSGLGTAITWESLIDGMRTAIDAYRAVIMEVNRAQYVEKAEDISDHLRMLLAAGSGTTDNHSGNPSIISANKALYPHFREMMSKFSKLVLSSHIAAADYPNPGAGDKCLQEAEGVMQGVYGYVQIARQQKGNQIPRLTPGFMPGITTGGSWTDNNLDAQLNAFAKTPSDSSRNKTHLDANLLHRLEEYRITITTCLRRLEEKLHLSEKLVTTARQRAIGDNICMQAGALLDLFKPWIASIESIDLGSIGTSFQKPGLLDFTAYKQAVYDAIGEVILTCQKTTAPLPDEWADVGGETLETRMEDVRIACRYLDSSMTQVSYALQLLTGPTHASSGINEKMVTIPAETLRQGVPATDPERSRLAQVTQLRTHSIGQMPASPPSRKKSQNSRSKGLDNSLPSTPANGETDTAPEEGPPYLRMEYQNEILWDMKYNPPQPRAGTLTALIEQLTRHDRTDTLFTNSFLMSYKAFISASELFQLLVKRFNLQPPPGLDRNEKIEWDAKKLRLVRFRVVNVLKTWIEQYWMEKNDSRNQNLLERMSLFAKSTVTNAQIPGGPPLALVIEQRIKGQDTTITKKIVLNLTSSAPTPILPRSMKKIKLLDIDATEFARQLTVMESKLYCRIKPSETLERIWAKPGSEEYNRVAPNIRASILFSNQLTNFVADHILAQSEMKKRVNVAKHFINIAQKCREMSNLSSLTAIISAMGVSPIYRLNRTWASMPPKTKVLLEEMRDIIKSDFNWQNYREALRTAQTPCVPFLGVYLTDLTFMEEGLPSLIKDTALLGYEKRLKTYEAIRDLQTYQNVPYALTEVPELCEWILNNTRQATDVNNSIQFDKSSQIEPKEREDEKIARLLSESGFL